MKVPKSIEGENEKLAQQVHHEWDMFCKAVNRIESSDEEKSIAIELACRLIWSLWDDEAKRETMQWDSWYDLFHPGDVALAKFFSLISDRMVTDSKTNQDRFYNMLYIDSQLPETHLLQQRHWTKITQFGGRISKLKEIIQDDSIKPEDKITKANDIIADKEKGEPDPEPDESLWDFRNDNGYWNGKRAVKVLQSSPDILKNKIRSRLTKEKVGFVLKQGEGTIIGSSDKTVEECATVVLNPNDPDYKDFTAWLEKKGIKVVG